MFATWQGNIESLKAFDEILNTFCPEIQFKINIGGKSVPFLDTRIYIDQNQINSNLHIKPTDRNQLLLFDSYHPPNVSRSIVRIRKLGNINRIYKDCPFHSSITAILNLFFRIIKNHWPLLKCAYPQIDTFKQVPIKAYRRNKTVRDSLVRSEYKARTQETKMTFLGKKRKGCYPCLNCIQCNLLLKGDHYIHTP